MMDSHEPRNDLMHDCLNATGAIYWLLKPYHTNGLLDDQHWAYISVCLHRIEQACKVYCDLKQGEEE